MDNTLQLILRSDIQKIFDNFAATGVTSEVGLRNG